MSNTTQSEEEATPQHNDNLVAIVGYSGMGKSASLRNIRNQDRWVYFNCEAGKRLPFRNKFNRVIVTDPYQVLEYFDELIENRDQVDGAIIDSITFLMDMFETQYVLGSADTMKGWSNYAQFFKKLMQQKVAAFGKPVIVIAHVLDTLDEKNMEIKTAIPIKGSLKNNGIEAYFTTVVAAKKVSLKELEKFGNKMLVVTEEEKELKFKHVFQTRITATTLGERLRSPMGVFDRPQTYIDNDAQVLLDHLAELYGEDS